MIKTVPTILIILFHRYTVECQQCTGCDPDIPSRQTPVRPEDWYREEIQSQICQAGNYPKDDQCKPCLVGTFMTSDMAKTGRYIFCPPCLKVSDSATEEIVTECNSTRDTEIRCKAGHYRDRQCECSFSQCRNCSVCGVDSQQSQNYQLRPCGQFENAVCCSNEDDVVEGNNCVRPTTNATATSMPSGQNVAQTITKGSNSVKPAKIFYSTILLILLTLFILL